VSATLEAEAVEDVQEAVRGHDKLLPRGGGTKPALSSPPGDAATIDLSELTGITEYDPEELTFTARAGTSLREIADALAENRQFLPFDPPFVAAGATLGGVVAAGAAGPLRYRSGGVRDFVLGVRFVDGKGRLVSGGGRVVKNAAGFDFPKLMVGSAGRLGVMLELSMKVFPAPVAWATMSLDLSGLDEALEVIGRLATAPFDLEALDLEPPGRLWLRLAGPAASMSPRFKRLEELLERSGERVPDDAEAAVWSDARDFAWAPEESSVAKVALAPRRVPDLEARLEPIGIARRYSSGGNLAWLAWPSERPREDLDSLLRDLDLAGVFLTGSGEKPFVGTHRGGEFARRVKSALDPDHKFLEI
jgi:glycolate oxidase FAD binding subunit